MVGLSRCACHLEYAGRALISAQQHSTGLGLLASVPHIQRSSDGGSTWSQGASLDRHPSQLTFDPAALVPRGHARSAPDTRPRAQQRKINILNARALSRRSIHVLFGHPCRAMTSKSSPISYGRGQPSNGRDQDEVWTSTWQAGVVTAESRRAKSHTANRFDDMKGSSVPKARNFWHQSRMPDSLPQHMMKASSDRLSFAQRSQVTRRRAWKEQEGRG